MNRSPLPVDAQAALQRGNKIEAIRLVRVHEGLGLKEAKDRVDAAAAAQVPGARRPSGLGPGEVPRRGLGTLVVAVAAGAAVWWYFLRAPG